MIIRVKTDDLKQTRPLTQQRIHNTKLNIKEMHLGKAVLDSKPQRFVFELTNACNLNCIMCGRNAADFVPSFFELGWFEKIMQAADSVEEITLMGWGEPTIHPDFKEMLKISHKHGLRKYFCTNGMLLDRLEDAIFEYEIDIIAVSLDGADKITNERIRRGVDFNHVTNSLRSIVKRRNRYASRYPHINLVFTAMRSNIGQLPQMVDLAAEIGLDEIKVVFLTVFDESMMHESLYNQTELVSDAYIKAQEKACKNEILLKLPYLQGKDPAGEKLHKQCHTSWRDFFLGSDGYVRSCMSSPVKLFHIDKYPDFSSMWNSQEYRSWREIVNDRERMDNGCKHCYQSSYANWNMKHSFIQIGNKFSPDWGDGKF